MPRGSRKPEASPFDRAVAAHIQLVGTTPVEKDALQRSLQVAYSAGELMVRSQELGNVRFANQLAPLYAGALALNEQDLVQPPLEQNEVAGLMAQKETLDLFTEGNGDTGQGGPTDPASIPTSGRK
jgi:hypothetical protein